MWEVDFCSRTPIALGYTRGHFTALVPMETDSEENLGAGANKSDLNDDFCMNCFPLTDIHGKLLPVHFLVGSEVGFTNTHV